TADRKGLFREAHGGTLFIDELGELPIESQAKLLRAIEVRKIRAVGEGQEADVDVRIVAATNRDLWGEVLTGRFREDLYFRLQVFPVVLAPLRERRADIAPLAEHLLGRLGMSHVRIDESARVAFEGYDWPGNVRELLNVLRRSALFAHDVGGAEPGKVIDGDLARRMIAASVFGHVGPTSARREPPGPAAPPAAPAAARPTDPALTTSLAEVERAHIERVLAAHEGNITKTAIALGIDRRTLQRKLKGYGYEESG
ncbi:MAG: sigma 54-interacting transcriptional regulator, partial [Myxococcales bacterium]|nr:sigma 54-interacting transcriptional regulator [Myxococcales bacterium]